MKTKAQLVKQKTKAISIKRQKGKKVKIEAKPLTEEQIKEFVKHYNEHKSFPGSKIPCNITGKLTTCVGPWMVKKIKEFGGAEMLLRKYVCRGAIKASKQKIKPTSTSRRKRKAKLETLKDEQKNWDIPKMEFSQPRPSTDSELSDITKSTCLRPDIHLNNDYYCNGCEYFDVCTNNVKRLNLKAVKKTNKK